MVHQLLADLAGVEAVQAAVAFGGPAGVLGLEAVVDEAPLVAWIQPGTGKAEPQVRASLCYHTWGLFNTRHGCRNNI